MTAAGQSSRTDWTFGFGPRTAEFAWRCQRCLSIMRRNVRACPSCAYTVYDPVHRKADESGGRT